MPPFPSPRLLSALRDPGPRLILFRESPGDASALAVREELPDRDWLWLEGSPLPAPLLASDLGTALQEQQVGASTSEPDVVKEEDHGFWAPFFSRLEQAFTGSRSVVVHVSGAEHLLSDARFVAALSALWSRVRARALPVHLVLTSELPGVFEALRRRGRTEAALDGLQVLQRASLTLREVAERVPGWRGRDVLRMYALLGGLPAIWSEVEPEVRPATNLLRLVRGPGSVVRSLAGRMLRVRSGEQPRSLAILHALARGARTWGEIRRGAQVFRSSSEIGPYLKGLVANEAVRVRASLDAAPGSRSRRYRIRESLVSFWLASLAHRASALDASPAPQRLLGELILPSTDALVRSTLPSLLEEYLRLHGDEAMPGSARETGALWGSGYDIDVAGTLTSGAAVYGITRWSERTSRADLDGLRTQLRETRYGFDREARLLVVFSVEPPAHGVAREFARDPSAFLLTPADLLGR